MPGFASLLDAYRQMTPYSICANLIFPLRGEVMRYILSKSALVCPSCGSSQLARSHRKGIYEYILRAVQVRPYRCLSCDDRHYRYRPPDTHGQALPLRPGNGAPTSPSKQTV